MGPHKLGLGRTRVLQILLFLEMARNLFGQRYPRQVLEQTRARYALCVAAVVRYRSFGEAFDERGTALALAAILEDTYRDLSDGEAIDVFTDVDGTLAIIERRMLLHFEAIEKARPNGRAFLNSRAVGLAYSHVPLLA